MGKLITKDHVITVLAGYAVYTLPVWTDMVGKVCGGLTAALLCWMLLLDSQKKQHKKTKGGWRGKSSPLIEEGVSLPILNDRN